MQFSSPTASYGYYRGSPLYMGQGSNQGANVSGNGIFSPGQGSGTESQGSAWTPTIMYLFVLIIAEMIMFGIIGRHI